MPSIALGSIGVTPLEMASAYATLAAGGVYSKPMAITKVVLPNGKVDTDAGWGKPQRERVIPDWVAATVTQVLEQNMLYGTGRGAHVYNHTDAGKTGTTDNYADAWFSGYTPRLAATVWIGYPQGEIPMLNVHGIAVSGPTFPAQIWHLVHGAPRSASDPTSRSRPRRRTPVWTYWRGQYQYSGAYGAYGGHDADERHDARAGTTTTRAASTTCTAADDGVATTTAATTTSRRRRRRRVAAADDDAVPTPTTTP